MIHRRVGKGVKLCGIKIAVDHIHEEIGNLCRIGSRIQKEGILISPQYLIYLITFFIFLLPREMLSWLLKHCFEGFPTICAPISWKDELFFLIVTKSLGIFSTFSFFVLIIYKSSPPVLTLQIIPNTTGVIWPGHSHHNYS